MEPAIQDRTIAQTQDELSPCARAILARLSPSSERATLVTLTGDLGAGKTALTKAIAAELGVPGEVISPTFVIMKRYAVPGGTPENREWKELIHVDLYRIESDEELRPLGWEGLLRLPRTLLIVEWPEQAPKAIPKPDVAVTIAALPRDAREIMITMNNDL